MSRGTQRAPHAAEAAGGETMSAGQRDYEARRAAKAGMSLDRWLEQKRRAEAAEAAAKTRAAKSAAPKKRGLLSRLIDRAHKPLS